MVIHVKKGLLLVLKYACGVRPNTALAIWSFVSYERPILDDEAKPQ